MENDFILYTPFFITIKFKIENFLCYRERAAKKNGLQLYAQGTRPES